MTYSNSLKTQASIESDFLDFSNIKDETYGPELQFQFATFSANSSYGLELKSPTYYIAQGAKVFKESLSASKDWQIVVKAHISNFTTNLPNPTYYAAITIGKIGNSYAESLGNHLNLNFTRSMDDQIFSNTINTGIYVNGEGDTFPVAPINSEDLFLKVQYYSSNSTCELSCSINGTSFNVVSLYNLATDWSLTSGDEIYIALVGTSKPFNDICDYYNKKNLNYNLDSGKLYLSNFEVTMLSAPTPSPSPVPSPSNGSSSSNAVYSSVGGISSTVLKSKKGGNKGKSSSAKKSGGGSSKKASASKSSSGKKSGAKKAKKK